MLYCTVQPTRKRFKILNKNSFNAFQIAKQDDWIYHGVKSKVLCIRIKIYRNNIYLTEIGKWYPLKYDWCHDAKYWHRWHVNDIAALKKIVTSVEITDDAKNFNRDYYLPVFHTFLNYLKSSSSKFSLERVNERKCSVARYIMWCSNETLQVTERSLKNISTIVFLFLDSFFFN